MRHFAAHRIAGDQVVGSGIGGHGRPPGEPSPPSPTTPGNRGDKIDVTEFSASTRAANLERMRRETFDVLIVGGGIVGAGVAREAACRGLRTALAERGDFASGTSGKTSRLVHGGLRYLRNYRIGLVRQGVRERDRLLATAPCLVHPLPFVIPVYRDRPPGALALRFGLLVYDLLSKGKAVPGRTWLRLEQAMAREPRLAEVAIAGAGIYYDAWTDDSRLVLAVVKDAAAAGAVVANYAEVSEVIREEETVCGGRVRDGLAGDSFEVRAGVVVNATGVWLDRLRTPRPHPTIRPTKGVHVFVPRARLGHHHAIALTVRTDGRVVFVLPWGDLTLVGTTDTDFAGDPDHVVADPADVDYLLSAVNEAFPDAHLTRDDVVSAYAGLRPLLRKHREDASESEVSRAHELFEDEDGLISVAGGKLTTHRAMAEEVVSRIVGRRATGSTSDRSLGPSASPLEDFTDLGLDEAAASHLQMRYSLAAVQRNLESPGARGRIVHGRPCLWAEVDLAVREEMALRLSDVLVRRLGLFYETPDQAFGVAVQVAARMGRILRWNPRTVEMELAEYAELVRAHRAFREDHGR